jgi:hypothetical protein
MVRVAFWETLMKMDSRTSPMDWDTKYRKPYIKNQDISYDPSVTALMPREYICGTRELITRDITINEPDITTATRSMIESLGQKYGNNIFKVFQLAERDRCWESEEADACSTSS